jgi:hypothetical protein
VFADVHNRLVRDEVIQGKPAADAVAQLRRADGEQVPIAAVEAQSGDGRGGLDGVAGPLEEDKYDELGELLDVAPRLELR